MRQGCLHNLAPLIQFNMQLNRNFDFFTAWPGFHRRCSELQSMPTRNLKRENLLVSYKIAQISKKHMEHLLNQNEELFCEGA